MSQPEAKNEGARAAESKSSAKKPYRKPEVRHERVFETMALSCGEAHSTQGPCVYTRRDS